MEFFHRRVALLVWPLALALMLASCAPAAESPVGGVTIPGVTLLKMVDQRVGWVVKGATVLRTTDGGRSWKDVSPKDQVSPEESRGTALDADHAWLAVTVPQSGKAEKAVRIYRTSDGGSTWAASDAPTTAVTVELTFLDQNNGWAMAHQGFAMMHEQVTVLGTTDGGKTWSVLSQTSLDGGSGTLPFSGDKSGLVFATKDRGFVTGYAPVPGGPYLCVTADGGRTWSTGDLPVSGAYAQSDFSTYPPVFHSATDGILPAFISGFSRQLAFYRTSDGGRTWQLGEPLTVGLGTPIWDSPSNGLIIVATAGGLQVSKDSGKSWTKVWPSIDLGEATKLSFASETTGWALVQGKLYKTVDGGKTWKR